jgi:hypothetical protein
LLIIVWCVVIAWYSSRALRVQKQSDVTKACDFGDGSLGGRGANAAMTTGSPRRRSGSMRSGCAILLVAAVFMAVFSSAMELFWTRIDQRRFPWAYEDSGRPALVGQWVGALTTARGERRPLMLDLRLDPLKFSNGRRQRRSRSRAFRRATSDKLVGELRMCGGPVLQRFTLHGNNLDDDASHFRLSFYPADSVPPDGLAPSRLAGTWNHQDSLKIEADLYERRGKGAVTNSADPVTGKPQPGALHRGAESDFRALCGELAGR